MFSWLFLFHAENFSAPTAKKHFNLSLECYSSVHTGVKPQECTHCNYSAQLGASLNKHILQTLGTDSAIVCNAGID